VRRREARGSWTWPLVVLSTLLTAAGVYWIYLAEGGVTTVAPLGQVESVTTTGTPCTSDSLSSAVAGVESAPQFLSLSGGLCYDYMGEESGAGQTHVYRFYSFGPISYPCGTSPVQEPATEIKVTAVLDGTNLRNITSISEEAVTAASETCTSAAVPVQVVSLVSEEVTIPAVPQLNLTLYSPSVQVSSLKAVVYLDGGTENFQFQSVTPSSPLASGGLVSKTQIVIGTVAFNGREIYPMTVSGTLVGGSTFSYTVHVQVAGA